MELEASITSVGPYSQVIRAGDFLYLSAQVAFVPDSDAPIEGDIAQQTTRIFGNIENELWAAGANLDQIVKVIVYIRDMSQFEDMNAAYAAVFTEPYPARTCVEVSDLPVENALLSVDIVAYSPQ